MKILYFLLYIILFLLIISVVFLCFSILVDTFWHCSFDHFFVLEDGFFCEECGSLIRPLPTVCEQCGAEFDRHRDFCIYCGGCLDGE